MDVDETFTWMVAAALLVVVSKVFCSSSIIANTKADSDIEFVVVTTNRLVSTAVFDGNRERPFVGLPLSWAMIENA